MISNLEIREQLSKKRIKHFELAKALGIHPCTLSHWLEGELSEEKKKKIQKAIREFKF